MMWKYLNKLVPNDIGVQFYVSLRRGIQAVLPSIPRCRRRIITQYDSSFAVVGPKLWNVLPAELNQINDFDMFKGKLTKLVLTVPDRPPILGYARANNNSLVEVIPGHRDNSS